jgi:hypothetical protein
MAGAGLVRCDRRWRTSAAVRPEIVFPAHEAPTDRAALAGAFVTPNRYAPRGNYAGHLTAHSPRSVRLIPGCCAAMARLLQMCVREPIRNLAAGSNLRNVGVWGRTRLGYRRGCNREARHGCDDRCALGGALRRLQRRRGRPREGRGRDAERAQTEEVSSKPL